MSNDFEQHLQAAKERGVPIADFMRSQARRGCTRKGNAFQLEIIGALEEAGWICDEAKPARRLIRNRRTGGCAWMSEKEDFFGAFDILAVKPGRSPMLCVQATTTRGAVQAKIRRIEERVGNDAQGRVYAVVVPALAKTGEKFTAFVLVEGVWRAVSFNALATLEGLGVTSHV